MLITALTLSLTLTLILSQTFPLYLTLLQIKYLIHAKKTEEKIKHKGNNKSQLRQTLEMFYIDMLLECPCFLNPAHLGCPRFLNPAPFACPC